jgi:hypothetical protein
MYIYNMYVYTQVECEYLKKARGTVTATARYQLPADKQVHHKSK